MVVVCRTRLLFFVDCVVLKWNLLCNASCLFVSCLFVCRLLFVVCCSLCGAC